MQTTREHLIEIGLQRIHQIGYAATGVKEILDLAGVPKGSFYHYFPSKEAFAQEVLQRYAARETQRRETILTSTEFWDRVGLPVDNLPEQAVMTADEMVDASLAGLDQQELITIPSLPNLADWQNFETARLTLGPNLSHKHAADRYRQGRATA